INNDANAAPSCSEVLPISADDVFHASAPPLHLPALDTFLSNRILFAEPDFTPSRQICTPGERDLFGLDESVPLEASNDSTFTTAALSVTTHQTNSSHISSASKKSRRKRTQLEVAGGQIRCPAQTYADDDKSRSTAATSTSAGPSRITLRQRPTRSGLPASAQPLRFSPAKYRRVSSDAAEQLDLEDLNARTLVSSSIRHSATDDKATLDNDDEDDDTKTAVESDSELDAATKVGDQVTAEAVASRISARLRQSPRSLPSSKLSSGQRVPSTIDEGVPSQMSTGSHPVTRSEMFPPLMLLKDNKLDELKSNAIGPRKPPGGLWSVNWLGMIFDMIIGVEGSSFAAGLIRLEAFRDLFQIMALQLHFQKYVVVDPTTTSQKAAKFLLQTLPAFLGFDLVSVFGYAVIFFLLWIVLTATALFFFWRMTRAYNPNRSVEGFDSQGWIYKSASRGTRLANTCLVFVLGLLYLPLSKLAVDALVWSSDFWPVPNPYSGGVDNPAIPPPLGDPDIWRQPMDFCYTTTMRRDAFNWAFVIIPVAALTILFYTLWYPYKLMKTIREMLPHVSPYNELGRKRSKQEMEAHYHRLLDRDKSPFNFLYNSYRRSWGYYKPLYILLFKLTNLVIIGVLAKDNCLFRSLPTKRMLVIQQITLIIVMALLLGVHLAVKPFVDKIGNRSEMVSRLGYVSTATIGLLVALNVQGSTVYNTTILYIVQACTYTGNIYFATIGTTWAAHHVKRWQNRIDFSIDMFSPLLDLNKHIKRRIWEETMSIVLLCGREYHMPMDQVIAFSMSEEDKWPPYLIDFHGSVAERHIENLKIVKQIGIERYRNEVEFSRTSTGIYRQELVHEIQRRFAGPDAFWRPESPPFPSGVLSFFGKAFMIPFPPTLVMRYDEGSDHSLLLTEEHEFEAFIRQNASPEVVDRKMVRQALRALEGQRVFCPFVQTVQVGDKTSGSAAVDKLFGRISARRRTVPRFGVLTQAGRRSEYVMATPISYMEGTLRIHRRREHEWTGYDFASGFDVSIVYDEGKTKESNGALTTVRQTIEVSASRAFGLTESFDMSTTLSRFLQDNESLVVQRAPLVEKLLKRYRREFEREARWKERTLPYSFLTDIFDNDGLSPLGLRMALVDIGCRRAVRNLPIYYEGCVTLMYERLAAINRSPVHRFWWLLFDELWRQNSADYQGLTKYRRCFSPQYPSSIAYRPMPRKAFEKFLEKRGLWKKGGSKGGPFNRGVLNRIYFYLNEIVFAGHFDGTLSTNPGWSHGGGPQYAMPPQSPASKEGRRRVEENPFADAVMDSVTKRAATIHVGLGHDARDATRRDFTSIDSLSTGAKQPWKLSSNSPSAPAHYTGGGTDYSITSVIVRPAYTWEQRLDGHRTDTRWQRFRIRALQWLSLHPVEIDFDRQKLYLYLKL
ncbi:hypothetical protein BCV70DRAFT_148120, partial [Testicularia cyperi]